MPDLNHATGIANNQYPRRMTILSQQIGLGQSLLRSLAGSNPFYTRKLDEAGTPYSIRNLLEFAESVPLTSLQELEADQCANPPWGTNHSLPLDRYSRIHLPSDRGRMGLRQLDTAESWEDLVANGAEILRSAGISSPDRVFFTSSFEERPGCHLPFQSGVQSKSLCLSGAGLDAPTQWKAILDFEATVLCGDKESLLRLVDHAAALGPGRSRIRLIVGDGRPGSLVSLRKCLVSVLPEVQLYDHYALPETGPVACECPVHPGLLHVLEPMFIPEVIDPVTGQLVEPGVVGELVLTTLFRPAAPLVRYRTGDLVRVSPDTTCDCGRHYTTLEGGVLGRVGG